jgi:thioredoxin 1
MNTLFMTIHEFHLLQQTQPAIMLYFYNDTCGVCLSLWPRVETLMQKNFPEIKLIRVDAANSRELAGQLRMMSIPGILLFLEGKEFLRANGLVSLQEMEDKIRRPYTLMFQ